ncbi:uncharacterized protein LOC103524116 [Trichonephila clavipes]|nr:uncharacterized protein LOC103524116 [Trichonephila clavipes]
MDFTEINSRGKRGELLGRIDRQNSRFRTAKTIIIKFGLHASFVELESAKSALNEGHLKSLVFGTPLAMKEDIMAQIVVASVDIANTPDYSVNEVRTADLATLEKQNSAHAQRQVLTICPQRCSVETHLGSVPILFNIFINDLPDLLASDGLTNTALFADDLAIWCSTPKRDQSKLNTILNLTLERLHLWCIENNMTVNLKKTTCQFFTLNRQPFSPQLVYNGMPVQQSYVSIYLGCALDNKLKWTKHAELVVSRVKATRKRLSILKRLTGVKWGCNRDTLNTTYKTYIQPVLNYCNEVLISASENVRKLLDTFHNQVLRMITGGVKTTLVLVMQLLCDLQPFTNIIEKNAAILFNRLIRLPNNSFWRDYDSDGGRNLKTQKGFIQCVRESIQYKVIKDVPFELLSFANPLDYAILDIRLDLVLNVRKRDLSPTALHAIALETINTRFPPEEWLHIYTDGSLLDFAQGAGIGVFRHLFSFNLHAGPLTTHFDGEVEAIHIALQQLAVRLPPIERPVILSDSTSALQALSNYNENNCLRVQNCRELLGKIKEKIVFQWVPSHCGLWGNERADFLAKKGTGILQNFRRDLTLHSTKLEIKRIFRESFRLTASRVARDKPWSTLCKLKFHCIPSSPRAAAVAKFRLLTGHDCLCAHLFRFNLVTSPICVLCDTGQDMTAAHLDECAALNDLNCIVKRSGRKGTRAASSLPDGRFFLADVRGKKPREMACVRFKDRTTSKRIRYGFITIKSTTLIGLNSPRKNTTLPTITFVEPRRTHIPV